MANKWIPKAVKPAGKVEKVSHVKEKTLVKRANLVRTLGTLRK